ncbi:hypothetical protein LIA77_07940 [Sarocladium implicatum]|nr:hypothetical protein LIA77_07940 [Sarocladium implicatum]
MHDLLQVLDPLGLLAVFILSLSVIYVLWTSWKNLSAPRPAWDWRTAQPRQLRPFKGVYHITMGIQADEPANLITVDKDYLSRVETRRTIIEEQGSRVHGCLPTGDSAVRELYAFLMRQYLPQQYPNLFKLARGGKSIVNSATSKEFPTEWTDADPNGALRNLAETVEEDMFLLHDAPDGHFSDAFVCCFPSGFDPSEKLGKLLKDIHGPVPAYEKIGASMERFFKKLEVGKNVKRTNWSVQTHARLFAATGNHITDQDKSLLTVKDIEPEECFLRVELQTLMRLPKTRAILFSFKTYLYPIPDVKAEGSGEQLAEAIEGLKKGNAPGMWTYKGSTQWGDRLCQYLRSQEPK